MHVASAFELLRSDHHLDLIGASFQPEEQKKIRSMVIAMVLGTDMASHTKHLAELDGKLTSGNLDPSTEGQDQRFVLAIMMHAADVSNPTKQMKVYQRWTDLIMEEFMQQGEAERSAGIDTHLSRG
jgi:calcium/calmodulin-dependent 3',5'-cyclic nucleotide phosphodiesterase